MDALHHDAHVRGVAFDVTAFDQKSSKKSFRDQENARPDDGAAGSVAAGPGEEGPADEDGDQRCAEAGHRAVRVLDDGGKARVVGEEVSVAEWPMVAAAGARARGADDRSFKDHEHHESNDHRSVSGQGAGTADAGAPDNRNCGTAHGLDCRAMESRAVRYTIGKFIRWRVGGRVPWLA